MKCRLTSAAAEARTSITPQKPSPDFGLRALGFGISARPYRLQPPGGHDRQRHLLHVHLCDSGDGFQPAAQRAQLAAGRAGCRHGGGASLHTNKLYEGTDSGDFGNLYPGYSWHTATSEAEINSLFQVDIVVRRHGVSQPVDLLSIFLYRPESPKRFGRPTFR